MKTFSILSALTVALACAGVTFVSEPTVVLAAEAPSLSAKVAKPLQEAQELLKNKNPTEALSKISEAQAASGGSADETRIINQLKVAAYAQLNDYANLAKAAEAVLATGGLTDEQTKTYRQAAAQGYYNSGNTAKFEEYAKDDPELQSLLAPMYIKQGNYADAERVLRQSIAAAGANANEDLYLLLADAQRKSGDVSGSVETMTQVLAKNPKPEYWKYVLGSLLNSHHGSDKQRLDIYRLLYATDSLGGAADYVGMAQTAFAAKEPGEAKRALDKGFAAGVLGGKQEGLRATANAKAAEDLKVLPGIESQAAAQASGDALANIGDAYLSNGQYEKAASHYRSAIAKGRLSDPVATTLHLGIAYAGAKDDSRARQTLSSVSGKGIYNQLASLWLVSLGASH